MFWPPRARQSKEDAPEGDVDGPLRRTRVGGGDCRAPTGIAHLANCDGRRATDEEMTSSKLDAAADKLQETADSLAAQGGIKAKLAQPLADDAEFLRKLKPSLIAARARGEAPTDERPAEGRVAPSAAQVPRPKPRGAGGGPNPWVVIGAALALGIMLAKIIDWRGHAHPRN